MGLEHPNFGTATHIGTLIGSDGKRHQVQFNGDHHDAAIDWLVTESGGYNNTLKVVALNGHKSEALEAPADDATDTKINRVLRTARLEQDATAAEASGFTLEDPLYALGRKVIDVGVENAKSSRLEFEAKPLIGDVCADFQKKITAEGRKNTLTNVRDIRMTDQGLLARFKEGGGITRGTYMGESSFDSFCARTPMGGSGYLKSCIPTLRAYNVNHWMEQLGVNELISHHEWETADPKKRGKEPVPSTLMMRARSSESGRSIFAVVSKLYTAFDCNQVAEVVAGLVPEDARGSIVYDGQKTRIEALFHSDVVASDYGVGEIFRAGVIVTTDDTGNGSIKVSSVIERNLCLNLIILQTAEQKIANIRHIGDYVSIKVKEAVAKATDTLKYFTEQWGYARQDVVRHDTALAVKEDLSQLSARELLGGILWAQMKRELVPVVGRKPEALKAALRAYDVEPNKTAVLTRSDIVNVWTRYAHEDAAQLSPWIEDDIQAAAGEILASKKPMPYEAPAFEF